MSRFKSTGRATPANLNNSRDACSKARSPEDTAIELREGLAVHGGFVRIDLGLRHPHSGTSTEVRHAASSTRPMAAQRPASEGACPHGRVRRLVAHARRASAISLVVLVAGCVSPLSLKQAVDGYNDVTTEILAAQLLTNIVRVGHRKPAHFTGVTSIAATFNFTVSAGATPALTGESGAMLVPTFGGSASDNPTFSIVPIEGEDFSRRLLNPMEEGKLTLLLRQYTDVDLLLRLMAGEFRVEQDGREETFLNRPSHRGYRRFRQVVLHLSSIQDRAQLYVEPLIFQRDWQLPAEAVSAESFREMEKEYSIQFDPAARVYHLSRRVTGRLIITNYDPDLLGNDEKIRMNAMIEQNAPAEVAVDIRPGYPGGEYPIQGKFRLRSFLNVLTFLGRSLVDEPEYHVTRDPRTPPVRENPAFTMELERSRLPILSSSTSAQAEGYYYAVKQDSGYPWNEAAFQLLTVLFQMTVVDLPKFNTPAITIAK